MDIFQLLSDFLENIKYTSSGPDSHYFNSQWEKKSWTVSRNYLIYRWIHFIMIAIILSISCVNEQINPTNAWSSRFINWTLVFHLIPAYFSVYFVSDIYIRGDRALRIYSDYALFRLYGGLHSCSIALALSMIPVYIVIIYGPEEFHLDVCFLTYVGAALVMLLDLFVVSHLVKMFDILYPLLFVFTFFEFTLVRHIIGGYLRYPFIYEDIRWSNPATTFTLFSIYLFFLTLVYMLIWCISVVLRAVGDIFELFSSNEIPMQELESTFHQQSD